MAENLNYDTLTSYCYKDDNHPNETENCEKYGRLYKRADAMVVCPSGWHLSSKEEWNDLKEFIGEEPDKHLKSSEGWNNDANGFDTYGFSALPAGSYLPANSYNLSYIGIGTTAVFWTSHPNITCMSLSASFSGLISITKDQNSANSVRCVKD